MNKENNLPNKKEMQEAIIAVLKACGGVASTKEIDEAVIDYLCIPEEIANIEHPDGLCTLYNYQMRWARTGLKGRIVNIERGKWRLLEK